MTANTGLPICNNNYQSLKKKVCKYHLTQCEIKTYDIDKCECCMHVYVYKYMYAYIQCALYVCALVSFCTRLK